ncbi:MAG: DUF459 domain-containing protein [Actinomycetota bacterium]
MPHYDPDSRLRAADPSHPTRTDTRSAGTVFLIAVSTLAVAALMNGEQLLERARAGELGQGRDVAIAAWEPVERIGSRLGLHLPRRGLDNLRTLDPTPGPGGRIVTDEEPPPVGGVGDVGDEIAGPTISPGTLGHSESSASPPAPSTTTPLTTTSEERTAARPAPEAVDGDGSTLDPEGPTRPGADRDAAPSEAPLRRPSADDPLRLLIIGDSTLDPVGNALLRDLGETGVAEGVIDYRVSTGLARPDFFDWPAHLRTIRPQLDPEVVVIMMGANDAQAFAVDNKAVEFGTDEWLAVYAARVSALLDELTADGRWVIWIGQPAMRSADFDTKMQQINRLYLEVIANHPRALFVDARPLSVDADGRYAAYLVDENGDRFQMRMTDGVHLTPAGGDRLSPVVLSALDEIAPLGPDWSP